MFTRKGFALATLPMCVLAIICLAKVAAASGIGNPPPIRESWCETPNDTAIIGTVSSVLGADVAVPIYVGSDDEIQAFQFKFEVSDTLVFDSVVAGSWQGGIDPPDTQGGYLIIGKANSASPMQPSTDVPFLTLWFNTHCKTAHATTAQIKWGPSLDPEAPSIYLVDAGIGGCLRDPIEVKTNGGVALGYIDINFSISNDTALIGDVVTVTVSCENDYEFEGFYQVLAIDENVLDYVGPFFNPTARVGDSAEWHWYGPQAIVIQGHNTNGFGTSAADGAALYQLNFQVVSSVDDISSGITFGYPSQVWGRDCSQELHNLTPQAVFDDTGSVTIPPYEAVFDLGEVVWNNQSTCDFTVPLLLKNNFKVTNFRLSIGYSDDNTNPLVFGDVASADPLYWPMTADGQYCSGTGESYANVEAYGSVNIDPSPDFQTIAWLSFHNSDADTADINYILDLIEYGCPPSDDPTWVETYDTPRGTTRYYYADTQVASDTGAIVISDPYTTLSVPGCMSDFCKWPPDCEWWATTGVYVNTNQDVDSVVGHLAWTPDYTFCVSLQNIDYDHLDYTGSAITSYTFYITDVSAGPYPQKFATVKLTNNKYSDSYGTLTVSNTSAVEACGHTGVSASGSGGGVFVYAIPASHAKCYPNGNGQKVGTVPRSYALGQNHPNPFNAGTVIDFSLSDDSHVRIEVFNILGQRVRTLIDDELPAGQHTIEWNGTNANGQAVATGVYLYRMRSGPFESTKKMLLLK